jgi:hypothetical protein
MDVQEGKEIDMKSRTVGRIQALMDPREHEVYRVRRGVPPQLDMGARRGRWRREWPCPGGHPVPLIQTGRCVRCGAGVGLTGVGVWAPLYFFTRRGYPATGIEARQIHRGCVPTLASCDHKGRRA